MTVEEQMLMNKLLNKLSKECERLHKELQKHKWIPVSERLPEDGTYLVTVKRITSHPKVDIDSFAKDLYKVDEFDFCDKEGKCGWYNYDSEYGYWEDDKVIAWMPLPEPHQKGEEE